MFEAFAFKFHSFEKNTKLLVDQALCVEEVKYFFHQPIVSVKIKISKSKIFVVHVLNCSTDIKSIYVWFDIPWLQIKQQFLVRH